MFTGIIEALGHVRFLDKRNGYQRTTLDAASIVSEMKVGDSVTLDGACHTAVDVGADGFAVESVEETLKRTTLGGLRVGSRVNLERAMRIGDRLDGHLVSGHIDGMGTVRERQEGEAQVLFTFDMPNALAPYVAEKGSICVDGISLTVVSVSSFGFSVAIIPHTMEVTSLSDRKVGDSVNLEVDMVARYLERLVSFGDGQCENGITEAGLRGMGWDRTDRT